MLLHVNCLQVLVHLFYLQCCAEMVDLLQHYIWGFLLCGGLHPLLHGRSAQLVAW